MLADHYVKQRMPLVEEQIDNMGYQAQQAQLKASQGNMKEARAHIDNFAKSYEVLCKENEFKYWADQAMSLMKDATPAERWRVLNEYEAQ